MSRRARSTPAPPPPPLRPDPPLPAPPPRPAAEVLQSPDDPDARQERKDIEWWTPPRESCLRLAYKGTSQKKIAERLGYSTTTIRNWLNDPRFVVRLEKMQSTAGRQQQLKRMHHASQVGDYFQTRAELLINHEMREVNEVLGRGGSITEVGVDHSKEVARLFACFSAARKEERLDYQTTTERLQAQILEGRGRTDITETRAVVLIRDTLGDPRIREMAGYAVQRKESSPTPVQEVEADLDRDDVLHLLEATLDEESVLLGFHQDYDALVADAELHRD